MTESATNPSTTTTPRPAAAAPTARRPLRRHRRWLSAVAAGAAVAAAAVPTAIGHRVVAATTCATSGFEAGTDGWSPWWSGTVDTSNVTAWSGSSSLHLRGTPATATHVVRPGDCASPASSATFDVRTTAGSQSVYLKTIDQVTGATATAGPFAVSTSWVQLAVALSTEHPTAVSLEAYGQGTTELYLDAFTLATDAAPPATTPPTTLPPTTLPTTLPPTTLPPSSPPGSPCTASFEGTSNGWGTWWSGQAAPSQATAFAGSWSLRLTGSPATAQGPVAPTACGATAALVRARTITGQASLYVKVVDPASGTSELHGPFGVTTSWSTFSVPVAGASRTVAVEAYGASELFLDEIALSGSPAPTTAPPTAPPTTPPTTTPVNECVNGFETGTDGWSVWWSGSLGRTGTARTGTGALLLSGAPATAQRRLVPARCGATGGSLAARTNTGSQRVYVKTVDDTTGTTHLSGPFTVTTSWQVLGFDLAGITNGTLAVEAYGTSTTDLVIDDVVLSTAPAPTAPPTTAPPTTVAGPLPGSRKCLVFLHGAGGVGSNSYLNGDTWWVLPGGNLWTANGLQWDYPSAAGYADSLATIRAQIDANACGQVVVVGFSNGGGMAAKLSCAGETFSGRLVGVILDDPVVDSVPLGCHRPPNVGVSMLFTTWMAGIGAIGGPCDPGWVCQGNRLTVAAYAAAIGTTPVQKPGGHQPETDHQVRASAFWR